MVAAVGPAAAVESNSAADPANAGGVAAAGALPAAVIAGAAVAVDIWMAEWAMAVRPTVAPPWAVVEAAVATEGAAE